MGQRLVYHQKDPGSKPSSNVLLRDSNTILNFIFTSFFFIGIPGLSFDIMLRTFDNEQKAKGKKGHLDLFSDPEMEEFFTKGIRGGQSFISQRYAEGENHPETPGNHLLYVDGEKKL